MFEGMPSTKRQRKLNKQALVIWGAAVLMLLPGGYIYWRHQNQVQARETVEAISRALAGLSRKAQRLSRHLGAVAGGGV